MVKKDCNNDFGLKIRLETADELRWTFGRRNCNGFLIDVISDISCDNYEEKYSARVLADSVADICNNGQNGYSVSAVRKVFFIDVRSFQNSGSRFRVPFNGTPVRVHVYVLDDEDNIVDCGSESVVLMGSIKLKYSVKNSFWNKTNLTVKFESSKGYKDSMAVYVVNINGKRYQYPITTAMLGNELNIQLPSKQDFVVQAVPQYKKIVKIETMN